MLKLILGFLAVLIVAYTAIYALMRAAGKADDQIERMQALSREVEEPPIWERECWPVEMPTGNYEIHTDGGCIATAKDEATARFICGSWKLVKALLSEPMGISLALESALNDMNVEVKE